MKRYVILTTYGALAVFTAGVMLDRAIVAITLGTTDGFPVTVMCIMLLWAAQLDNVSQPTGKIDRSRGDLFWHMEDKNG